MKKILLTLGATTTALTPIAAVVACGQTDESSPDTGHKNNHSKDRGHSNNHTFWDVRFLDQNLNLLYDNISSKKNKIKKLPSEVPALTNDNLISEMFPSIGDKDDLERLKKITFTNIKKSSAMDDNGSLQLSFTMNYKDLHLVFEERQFDFYTTSDKQYEKDLADIKAINATSVWTRSDENKKLTSEEWFENLTQDDLDSINKDNFAIRLDIPDFSDWGKKDGKDSHEYDGITVIGFKFVEDSTFEIGGNKIPPKGWWYNKNTRNNIDQPDITLDFHESALVIELTVQKGEVQSKIFAFVRGFYSHRGFTG